MRYSVLRRWCRALHCAGGAVNIGASAHPLHLHLSHLQFMPMTDVCSWSSSVCFFFVLQSSLSPTSPCSTAGPALVPPTLPASSPSSRGGRGLLIRPCMLRCTAGLRRSERCFPPARCCSVAVLDRAPPRRFCWGSLLLAHLRSPQLMCRRQPVLPCCVCALQAWNRPCQPSSQVLTLFIVIALCLGHWRCLLQPSSSPSSVVFVTTGCRISLHAILACWRVRVVCAPL